MPNTTAVRTRPYTSPHPISRLQADAIALRDQHFATRRTCIADMLRDNPQEPDEFYWTMVYDLEHAPTVTARQRLLEHGIIPVPPQELSDHTSLHDELWTVIEALSMVGIFLFNTNHLTDSNLYARLYYKILDEPTRLMPPSSEAAEFIDCLHPLDLDYPLGKLLRSCAVAPSFQPNPTTTRGPICSTPGILQCRDSTLPAPTGTGTIL